MIDYQTITVEDLVFRNPPEIRAGHTSTWQYKLEQFVHVLANRSGEWAVFRGDIGSAGSAYAYASTYRRQFPHTEWKAAKEADGSFSLYARVLYV
jgi:hypothetical protein